MMVKSSDGLISGINQTMSEKSAKAMQMESKNSESISHRRFFSNQSCKLGERITTGIFSPQSFNRQQEALLWLNNNKKHQVKVQDVIQRYQAHQLNSKTRNKISETISTFQAHDGEPISKSHVTTNRPQTTVTRPRKVYKRYLKI